MLTVQFTAELKHRVSQPVVLSTQIYIYQLKETTLFSIKEFCNASDHPLWRTLNKTG